MIVGQFYKFGAKHTCCSQWHTGLSGVHRTVSDALAGALRELAVLRNSRRSSTKNHRTVQCAIGLSGERSNGRLRDCARGLKRQKSEDSL
jgi:hypothetical protein